MDNNFKLFQEKGGKFRVSVTKSCNLDCFFCHNEGMHNPRREGSISHPNSIPHTELIKLINNYIDLGGKQVNITGGEPLLFKELPEFLNKINKRDSLLVLNTNAISPEPLLINPLEKLLDCLLISLHTTDNENFEKWLGKPKADILIQNILSLRDKGYNIELNYSLGNYNIHDFENVLNFSIKNQLPLKVITLIRFNTYNNFYKGKWVNPNYLEKILSHHSAVEIKSSNSLGGRKKEYSVNGIKVIIKNVGMGKLKTDYCLNCNYSKQCGEGIYGLRVGIDGIWKPCLLNSQKYTPLKIEDDYKNQILEMINSMIGEWENSIFEEGVPV